MKKLLILLLGMILVANSALSQNKLFGWGDNYWYQLGIGQFEPTQIGTSSEWKSISCGGYHTMAIRKDGTMWGWGQGSWGALGDSTTMLVKTPKRIGSDTNWKYISCGGAHTLAIKTDGSLWAWGHNDDGELGIGNNNNEYPIRTKPVRVDSSTDWSFVSCGGSHTFAIKTDGSLWGWGNNVWGQVGDSSNVTRYLPTRIGRDANWIAVSCGGSHTIAIKSDGSLWAWGANHEGQIGDGTNTHRNIPVRVGTSNNWKSISCGVSHTIAIKSDGSLWAWGLNMYGQLGNSNSNWSSTIPIQIGASNNWRSASCGGNHTIAIMTDGSLWAWGRNIYGEIGNGSDTIVRTPEQIGASLRWDCIAGGGEFTMAIKTDGTLWGWGDNWFSQIGLDRIYKSPQQSGSSSSWRSVDCDRFHSAGIKTDGTIWTWGAFELGYSEFFPYRVDERLSFLNQPFKISPTQKDTSKSWRSVSCGYDFIMAIKTDGSLWGLGFNDYGQIGNDRTNGTTFIQIGTDKNWQHVACGKYSTLAIKKDGSLWAWGYNGDGQLGDGTKTNRNIPVQIGTDTNWHFASCGNSYTIAIKTDGTLWSWGSGNLGDSTTISITVPIQIGTDTDWAIASCGDYHAIAIKTDGTLWAWGDNTYGELGDGTNMAKKIPTRIGTDTYWKSVSCGYIYSVAIKKDGTLWSWGSNFAGQIGDGTTNNRNSPVQIGTSSDWTTVACGFGSTLALQSAAIPTLSTKSITDITYYSASSGGEITDDGEGSVYSSGICWNTTGSPKVSDCNAGDTIGIGSFTYSLIGLSPLTTYYVRAFAINSAGIAYGNELSFTTLSRETHDSGDKLFAWGNNSTFQLGYGYLEPFNIGYYTGWKNISCGANHTFALTTDSTLWAWGLNSSGQLGDGTNKNSNVPLQIGLSDRWIFVSCGANHTVAIKSDGTLWAWGNNGYGQLGDGTNINRNTPIQIGSETNWCYVSSGNGHTLAIKTNGTLWAWGNNGYGQLGIGGYLNYNYPVQIGTATNWKYVSSGGGHTIAIKTDGTLWGWGHNNTGQLGDSSLMDKRTPVQIGTATDWSSVICGSDHTIAIKTNGTLWAWGYNYYNQLGDGTNQTRKTPIQIGTDTDWNKVICGSFYTMAIKTNSSLWGWGSNNYGQIGDSTNITRSVPTQIGTGTDWNIASCGNSHTMAIKADGSLWGWGNYISGQLGNNVNHFLPFQIATSNWNSVYCSDFFTFATKADGTLWAWGMNSSGQLGDGTIINKPRAIEIGTENDWRTVSCGDYHAVAIKTDGTLWTWGDNSWGELGDGTYTSRSIPSQIGTATDWKSVSCGMQYTIAIKTDGTLWAWGYNASGNLGDSTYINRNVPIQIGTSTDWKLVSCGDYHSIAIKMDGTLWAWGVNSYGQLGDGTYSFKIIPVQIDTSKKWSSVACGEIHTLAIKDDGTLWAWGYNNNGQLGDGTDTNRLKPVQVGTADNWSSVSAGATHTIAIKTDGTLWAWGNNNIGQLGDGTTDSKKIPIQIGLENNWKKVVAGAYHSFALQSRFKKSVLSTTAVSDIAPFCAFSGGIITDDGGDSIIARGVCWNMSGSPSIADLHTNDRNNGTGTFTSAITGLKPGSTYFVRAYAINSLGVSYGNELSFKTKSGNKLFSWGYNYYGQLGHGDNVNRDYPEQVGNNIDWYAVSSGDNHTVAIKTDGTLWAWGDNGYGQLGDGTYISRTTPVKIGSATDWKYIACGGNTTLAIKAGGSLWAWGDNEYGQLGDGTNTSRNTPKLISTSIWSSVSCGGFHTAAVKTDGTLWTWGHNFYGQLGDMTYINKNYPLHEIVNYTDWESVSCGGFHTAAIKKDGSFLIWGSNERWQLGYIDWNDVNIPWEPGQMELYKTVSCGDFFTAVTTENGNLLIWGGKDNGEYFSIVDTSKVWCSISCGSNHILAIKKDGTLWAWGANNGGQIGDSTFTDRTTFVKIGSANNWSSVEAGGGFSLGLRTSNVIPYLTAKPITDILSSSASSGGIITDDGGYPVTDRGVCWNTSGSPTISDNHTSGVSIEDNFTSPMTGLTSATHYSVRAFATNQAGTAYGDEERFWTLSTEPSAHAAFAQTIQAGSYELALYFQSPVEIQNCAGYLILRAPGQMIPTAEGIVNGVPPTYFELSGETSIVANISSLSQDSYFDTGLDPGAYYSYIIIPYNWDGVHDSTYNYHIYPQPQTFDGVTLSLEPTAHSNKFSAGPVGNTSVETLFQNAGSIDNCSGYILLRNTGDLIPDPSSITDGVSPTSLALPTGTTLAGTTMNLSTTTLRDNGLTPNTLYTYSLIPFNWNGTDDRSFNYRIAPTIPITPAYTNYGPTYFPHNFRITNISRTGVTLEWSDVTDGLFPTKYLIKAATGGYSSIVNPVDGVPEINSNYVTNVTQGSRVVIFNNMAPDQQYFFEIFPYRGSGSSICYKVIGDGIPGARAYLVPFTQASDILFNNVTTNSISLSFTSGSGQGRLVICKSGSAIGTAPIDNFRTYSADASFTGSGSTVDVSGKIVYIGAGNLVTVTDLQPGTIYYFKVFEFNGSGPSIVYNLGVGTNNPKSVQTYNEPTNYPTNFAVSSVSSTSITLTWTDAIGSVIPDGYLIKLSTVGYSSINLPLNGVVEYNSTYVKNVLQGSQTVTFNRLPTDQRYFIEIFPYKGNNTLRAYKTFGSIPQADSWLVPNVQASNLSVSQFARTSLSLQFQSGSGIGRLLLCKRNSINTTPLTQWTTYTADASFTGNGSTVDGSGKVVYIGDGNAITVTDLLPRTVYYFKIMEYNGYGSTSVYNMANGTRNSKSFTTLPREISGEDLVEGKNPDNFAILSIYPNPANDCVNLDIYSPDSRQTALRVYDMTGRLMSECSLIGLTIKEGYQTVKLNTQSLQSGMYLIDISLGNELIYTQISIAR